MNAWKAEKYAKRVADDLADGVKSGSAKALLIALWPRRQREKFVINGALPYANVKVCH